MTVPPRLERPRKHWSLVVLGLTCLILLLRLPESLFRAEFWADDGPIYSDALAQGITTVFETLGGYLVLGHRCVVWIETLLPPAYAPLLGNGVALAAFAATAAFAASRRMPWDRRTGTLIALGIVLLPASFQVIGNLAHVQWAVTLWLSLVALSREPERAWSRNLESAMLGLGGLTGPGAVLLLPLFIRGPRRRLAIVAVAAVIQVLILGGRRNLLGDFTLLPFLILERVFVVPVVGPNLAAMLPPLVILMFGGAIAFLAGLLWANSPSLLRLWTAWLGLVIPIVGVIASEAPTFLYADPSRAPRYFWTAGVAMIVLVATQRGAVAARPLIFLLLIGMVLHLRIYPPASENWEGRSRCIGGPTPCEVPIAPDGWSVRWEPSS